MLAVDRGSLGSSSARLLRQESANDAVDNASVRVMPSVPCTFRTTHLPTTPTPTPTSERPNQRAAQPAALLFLPPSLGFSPPPSRALLVFFKKEHHKA